MKNYDHLIGQNVRMVVRNWKTLEEFTGILKSRNGFYSVDNGPRCTDDCDFLVSIEPLEFVEGCVATFPNGNTFTRARSGYWYNDKKEIFLWDNQIRFTGASVTWPKKFDEEATIMVNSDRPTEGMLRFPREMLGKKVRVVEL